MKVDRRTFLEMAGAAGMASISRPSTPGETLRLQERVVARESAPNILIFMPDQQNGSTVLSSSPVHKPNMDRFRRESVVFTSAYCPAPHCCPSRASFMTGLYPSEHGVFNNVTTDTAIHPNPYPGTPFWGLWLKAAGYNMGYSGKLHVGREVTPESCGFENVCALEQDSL